MKKENIQSCQGSAPHRKICKFQVVTSKTKRNEYLYRNWKVFLKFILKCKEHKITKTIQEKRQSWKGCTSNSNICSYTVIKTV